ncbi:MAG: 50S ribosomal protein L24 [Saprospiraceae bacterium]|jgi:large subunit ribosomal protein L24|nr:50S ribosomal protein L24 [Saprospiraceae bacterium]
MSTNKIQNRFQPKLKVKKGDKVKVIAGNNKGEEGEIVKVYPEKNRAVVEGVNMRKRHAKGNQPGSGQIQEFAAPIHISNLMVIDPKNGQPTRVGRKEVDGKLVRYSKKTGEIL